MDSIGQISSDYKQRFGIPRQSGLAESAEAKIILSQQFSMDSVRGLTEFSHLWVIFSFHASKCQSWKQIVRPPRLGGRKGRGVFATRSPFRPSALGLSAVKLKSCQTNKDGCVEIIVLGGDFLDKTPVIDIKPYVPYADALFDAHSDWARNDEKKLMVNLAESALDDLDERQKLLFKQREQFIFESLALDPRPAHERCKDGRKNQSWSAELAEFDVSWIVTRDICSIISVKINVPRL